MLDPWALATSLPLSATPLIPLSSVPCPVPAAESCLPKGVNLMGMLFPVRLMKNSWTALTHPHPSTPHSRGGLWRASAPQPAGSQAMGPDLAPAGGETASLEEARGDATGGPSAPPLDSSALGRFIRQGALGEPPPPGDPGILPPAQPSLACEPGGRQLPLVGRAGQAVRNSNVGGINYEAAPPPLYQADSLRAG